MMFQIRLHHSHHGRIGKAIWVTLEEITINLKNMILIDQYIAKHRNDPCTIGMGTLLAEDKFEEEVVGKKRKRRGKDKEHIQ